MSKKCEDCTWVDKFKPRKDEIERGLLLGCKYPNYEGYTKSDMAERCCFFTPRETKYEDVRNMREK